MIYYLIGVIIIMLCLIFKLLNIYIGLGLISYYIIYYVVQQQNELIKDKIMKMIGTNKEDDNYNSEEHFIYIKRRNSITNLIQYYNKDDT